jgi:hypothetical protein
MINYALRFREPQLFSTAGSCATDSSPLGLLGPYHAMQMSFALHFDKIMAVAHCIEFRIASIYTELHRRTLSLTEFH